MKIKWDEPNSKRFSYEFWMYSRAFKSSVVINGRRVCLTHLAMGLRVSDKIGERSLWSIGYISENSEHREQSLLIVLIYFHRHRSRRRRCCTYNVLKYSHGCIEITARWWSRILLNSLLLCTLIFLFSLFDSCKFFVGNKSEWTTVDNRSVFMPPEKHFAKRQAEHRRRVSTLISHWLFFRHGRVLY